MKKTLIYSPKYRSYDYGPNHPLRPARLYLTNRLMEFCGLLDGPDILVAEPEPADELDILRVHSTEYVDALKRADEGEFFEGALRFGLGFSDNPIFEGLYELSLLVCGGTIKATREVVQKRTSVAFHTGGGFHHAHFSRAAGFCYLNDAAAAIAEQVESGKKVFYLDLDAHHGDGVQEAFYGSDRVLTVSFHESPEHLFPGTGYVEEIGEGEGEGYCVNIPLYPGTADELHHEAFEAVVPPLIDSFDPDLVMLQLGVDCISGDPLAHLALTTASLEYSLRRLMELYSGGLVALGGGGYDMDTVARAWTLAWSVFLGRVIPDTLPEEYTALRRDYGASGDGKTTFRDPVPDPTPDQNMQGRFLNDQLVFLRGKKIIP